MHRFVCRGYHSYAPWEYGLGIADFLFAVCLFADSLTEASTLARALAPWECNKFSVVCIDPVEEKKLC